MSIQRFILATLFVAAFASCSVASSQRVLEEELFGDPSFERGFRVVDNVADPTVRGDLRLLFEGEFVLTEPPLWGLATHASRYDVVDAELFSDARNSSATTPGQRVALRANSDGDVVLTLTVKAENEYFVPRKDGERWVHLLLTRDFKKSERVALRDATSLIFSCEARVADVEKTGAPTEYDPNLHTAQASFYFALVNANPKSPDYRDFIWFGVSFYDARFDVQDDYIAVDGDPKKIGTGKLIYRLGGKRAIDEFMGGVNPISGNWVRVEFDLKKMLPDAIKAAHERNFLTRSKADDFELAHFNFGWETTGTFRSELNVKNLRLVLVSKTEE